MSEDLHRETVPRSQLWPFVIWGYYGTPIMENQMEKKMEKWKLWFYRGCIGDIVFIWDTLVPIIECLFVGSSWTGYIRLYMVKEGL